MQYTFETEIKRNVNVPADMASVAYHATAVEGSPPKSSYRGVVDVSPHDANPDEAISRDIFSQMQRERKYDKELIEVEV